LVWTDDQRERNIFKRGERGKKHRGKGHEPKGGKRKDDSTVHTVENDRGSAQEESKIDWGRNDAT